MDYRGSDLSGYSKLSYTLRLSVRDVKRACLLKLQPYFRASEQNERNSTQFDGTYVSRYAGSRFEPLCWECKHEMPAPLCS